MTVSIDGSCYMFVIDGKFNFYFSSNSIEGFIPVVLVELIVRGSNTSYDDGYNSITPQYIACLTHISPPLSAARIAITETTVLTAIKLTMLWTVFLCKVPAP